MNQLKAGLAVAVLTLNLASCVPVETYQRAMLNDEDMALTTGGTETFESNVEAYREAASGGTGGKVGGGCGCN